MQEDLWFTMGKIPARLPAGILYAKNHMWARPETGLNGNGLFRHGFTHYAILLMKDVYFLEWNISEGDPVSQSQEIGHIETSKAESGLYCPAAGTLVRFNAALRNDPSAINTDGYGAGWLFDLDAPETGYMNAEQYLKFLSDNWEKTQAMLKGKMNQIEDDES